MKKLAMILLILASSCMKTPTPNQDFGTEITPTAVNQSLIDAQNQAMIQSLPVVNQGEYVYTERTNQVETLFPVTVELTSNQVAAKVEDSSKLALTITGQIIRLNPDTGNMEALPKTQQTECLEKTSNGCANPNASAAVVQNSVPHMATRQDRSFLNQSLHLLYSGTKTLMSRAAVPVGPTFGAFSAKIGDLSLRAIMTQTQSTDIHWTFHNLAVTDTKIPLPSMVNVRPDCGGRTGPCGAPLNAKEITWDQVDWTSEQYPVKYSFNLIFSKEVPYFATLLMSCITTTIPFNEQRISVMQCENVRDFSFGQAN